MGLHGLEQGYLYLFNNYLASALELWSAFTHLLIYLRPGREADHSPPTSAEVKKMCMYTSTPSYAFMVFNRFYQVNYTHLEFQCVLFAKEFNKARIPSKQDTGNRLRSFV
jgi:hypothetical protein